MPSWRSTGRKHAETGPDTRLTLPALKTAILVAVIVVAPGAIHAQQADTLAAESAIDPSGAIARLQTAHESLFDLQASFVHTKEVPLFDETISSSGVLSYRKPDQLLLQYTEPDSSLVLIADHRIWLYYPELQQAHRYDVDPELVVPGIFLAFGGSAEGLADRFDVEVKEAERSTGYFVERIVLTPKEGTDLETEVRSIELLIRRETNLPVRCEFWEVSGDHTVFAFDDFSINPGLQPSLFTFVPPEGTEVFEVEGESW